MTSIPTGLSAPGSAAGPAAAMSPEAEADARFQPFALQVLSLLLFGAFAIVATILAFVHFWPAGVVLALFLAWRGFGPTARPRAGEAIEQALGMVIPCASTPATAARATGNASFDAYRADMLDRLEEEQKSFEDFLARLRAAKDQGEFDRFMDDRARRGAGAEEAEDDGPR